MSKIGKYFVFLSGVVVLLSVSFLVFQGLGYRLPANKIGEIGGINLFNNQKTTLIPVNVRNLHPLLEVEILNYISLDLLLSEYQSVLNNQGIKSVSLVITDTPQYVVFTENKSGGDQNSERIKAWGYSANKFDAGELRVVVFLTPEKEYYQSQDLERIAYLV